MQKPRVSLESDKSWLVTVVLGVGVPILIGVAIAAFGGKFVPVPIGLHRFYVGKPGTGFLQVITFGGLFVWWVIDIVQLFTNSFTDKQGGWVLPEARKRKRQLPDV